MKISQVGIDLIKKFEGCALRAYKPLQTEIHFTIGYGHYGADVTECMTITQAKAEELLKGDLKRFEDGVNKYVTVDINQNQFDALVSFSYNVGISAFSKSTMCQLINKKDFAHAANEFDRWNKAGGHVLSGLTRRRAAEKELFLKVDKPQPQQSYYLKTGSFASKKQAEQLAYELKKKYGWTIHVMEVE